MKNLLPIIISVALIGAAAGYYFYLQTDKPTPTRDTQEKLQVYTSPELGLSFTYRVGANGYTISEMPVQETNAELVHTLTLMQTRDAENIKNIPIGSEYPAAITVAVFTNKEKQWPQTWADTHSAFSNITQKIDGPTETTIGGANAIYYQTDGLYRSNNAVVAHGDNIYLFIGQFLDKDSDLYRDLQSILDTVRFIPKPEQK